jgi:hypothetical protein
LPLDVINEHKLGRLCLFLQVSAQKENRPDFDYICTIPAIGGISFWFVEDQNSHFAKLIQKIDT